MAHFLRIQFFLAFSIIPCLVLAQHGRNSDGRAYRIDSEGNKVVDYIADLEMNVDSLNRQVQGLETELQEKIQVIQRLEQGQECTATSTIKEKDLGANTARRADNEYSWSCPKTDCAGEVRAVQNRADEVCNAKLENVRGEVADSCRSEARGAKAQADKIASQYEIRMARLQEEAQASLDQKKSLERKIHDLQQRVDAVTEVQLQKEDLETVAAENAKLTDKLQSEQEALGRLSSESRDVRQRIAELQDEFEKNSEEYELLRTRNAAVERNIETAKSQAAALSEEARAAKDVEVKVAGASKAEDTKALNTKTSPAEMAVVDRQRDNARDESKASLSPAYLAQQDKTATLVRSRMIAVESVKSSTAAEIAGAQNSINLRDRMYKEYQASKKSGISFSPSAAVSSQRDDLPSLRARLENASSMRDISYVRSAVGEIQKKMQDDIALMKRLQRLQ